MGNFSVSGTTTLGGGTPIGEYVSTTFGIVLSAVNAGSCSQFTTAPLNGFAPGISDTISLGIPSSLVNPAALGTLPILASMGD